MWKDVGSEKWMSVVDQSLDPKSKDSVETPAGPTITISRATGVGGYTVASRLAEYLQTHAPCPSGWTVWSKNLVQKVLEDHRLQGRVADFIREGHKGMLRDSVEEWLGLHPSAWTLVEQTNTTMLQLAKMGNVILMGWGAFLVTGELETAFHVRLVASLEKKLEKVLPGHNFDQKAALRYIKKEDEGRRRYIKDNFGKDVSDPLLYHITVNLDLIPHDEAARLIGDEVIRRFKLDGRKKAARSETRLT
jgi:cytidylate kinase